MNGARASGERPGGDRARFPWELFALSAMLWAALGIAVGLWLAGRTWQPAAAVAVGAAAALAGRFAALVRREEAEMDGERAE